GSGGATRKATIDTAAGGVSFAGPVAILGTASITTHGLGAIVFNSTIDGFEGIGGNLVLDAGSSSIVLNGAIGGNGIGLERVIATAAAIQLGGSIPTAPTEGSILSIELLGQVTLANDVVLTSGNNDVALGSVGGAHNFTVDAGAGHVLVGGDILVNGNVALSDAVLSG